MNPEHELMVITSVQGYCRCGGWGMATDGGIERLRALHSEHIIPTECREPDPERFCATSCGFDRTGHGQCRPSTPPSDALCCGPCSRGQHAACDGNEHAVCECRHSLSLPPAPIAKES